MAIKKEVCRYVDIKIFTGKESNPEDYIFNQTIYDLIRKKIIDCKFRLAGVEFEEILMRSSSMKSLDFDKETSFKGNMFIVISGYFPEDDTEYLKYIRYVYLDFGKENLSSKGIGETTHKIDFHCKLNVITNITTKEKELEDYTKLEFLNKN